MVDPKTGAVRACLANSRRLLEDAVFLEFSDPPATAYFLTLIAQEEAAKGFLLALVVRCVIPWNRQVLRATRDHTCKQLLCIVMDYLNPELNEFWNRCNAMRRHEHPNLPAKVADAINILRHEKIGRWVSQSWVWGEDPDYDPDALAIAEGRRDRSKQDALYVRLASDGGVASVPTKVTRDMLRSEMERAERFAHLAESIVNVETYRGLDYDKVEDGFRIVFAPTGEMEGRA